MNETCAPPANAVADYWLEHYVKDGLCSLCANSGVIDTTGLKSPIDNRHVGRQNWCICPNGQALRRAFGERPKQ